MGSAYSSGVTLIDSLTSANENPLVIAAYLDREADRALLSDLAYARQCHRHSKRLKALRLALEINRFYPICDPHLIKG